MGLNWQGRFRTAIEAAAFCIGYIVNLRAVKILEEQSFLMQTGQYVPSSSPNEQPSREAFSDI